MRLLQTTLSKISLLSFFAIGSFLLTQPVYAVSASVGSINGEVMLHKASAPADSWEALKQDSPLESGDTIKTQKGTCVVNYTDQAAFTLDENTTLTITEKTDAQDLTLLLGKIKGKVNKQKAEQPFRVNTPAAVATVRGTEVDFSFNDKGELLVDLHNGKIQVVNDVAELKLDLEGKKSVTVHFDDELNKISLRNECGSEGPVSFSILGADYAAKPCEETEVELATAGGEDQNVQTNDGPDSYENIDEGREPISPSST
jgi:hypothetical protein